MPRSAALALSLLFVLLAAACGGSDGPEQLVPTATAVATPTRRPTPAPVESVEVRIRDLVIQAETAITAEERGQGLSDRPSLAEDAGMLFFMSEPRIPGFHMRNMQFPLDFIWISAVGVVVDVTENVPHPAEAGETFSGISPNEPVLFVLEVNAGVVHATGIEIGDAVAFEPDIL